MSEQFEVSQVLTRSTFRMVAPFGRVFSSGTLEFEEFIDSWPVEQQEISGLRENFHRWHRIFLGALQVTSKLKGPTLDVASGNGVIYPAIKRFLPLLLPYSVSEMRTDGSELTLKGDLIPRLQFECDKEVIPAADRSYGAILFLDVLEHLLVDPMWTLFEFNRILADDGHLIISTPNAGSFDRALYLLMGLQHGSETEYKPTSLYQRHNREWVPVEIVSALKLAGFEIEFFETFRDLFPPEFNDIYSGMKKLIANIAMPSMLGPEIVLVARKSVHKTLTDPLPEAERWPDFLYSALKNYHRRPKIYPIVVGDDYQ